MPEVNDLNISVVKENFNTALRAVSNLEELDEIRVRFIGKKGDLTLLLRGLGKLPPEQRKEAGREVNKLRDEIEHELEIAGKKIRDSENEKKEINERIDVTLPEKGRTVGAFHPVMQTMHEIANIMHGLGYSVATGCRSSSPAPQRRASVPAGA
ncbi:MAG: hypothetical protein IKN30_06720 [Synergistaceae bacterium]|nr:hypothetical protein [Synergistaceae bacterium]